MDTKKGADPQQQLKDLINQSNRILVACGKNAQLDLVAAILGLDTVLEDLGKAVNVVCSEKLPDEAKTLVGWEKIGKDLAKDFVITLTSAVGNVEKVSYFIEGEDLNLVIRPHPQAPPFSKDRIKYKEGGGDYDLIFVLGSQKLPDLGKLYKDEENIFSKTAIINIDKQKDNSYFGRINIVHPNASSLSEIVTRLFRGLGIKLNKDAATNLLLGLTWATDNFRSPNALAETFEAAAFCLRSGAQRLKTPLPLKKGPQEEISLLKEEDKTSLPQKNVQPKVQPKEDWLKPKIYQGGELI